MWPYCAFMLLTFIKEFEKHYVQAILFVTLCFSVTLVKILSCFSLVFTDFSNLIFLFIRAIVAFTIFEAIKNKDAGFE